VKLVLKKLVASFLFRAGYFNAYINNSRNKVFILMYHRILPKDKCSPFLQSGMFVTNRTFEKHINFIKNRFNVIFLGKLLNLIQNETSSHSQKPFCVVTFDDGWRDNYDYLFPIIKKYQIPVTIFLPTNFIGSNKLFWTDEISRIIFLIKNNYEDQILNLIQNLSILESEDFEGPATLVIEKVIAKLKKYSIAKIEEEIQTLTKRTNITLKIESSKFLSWDQISDMYNSGIVKYGSHTANHQILTTLPKEDIMNELKISQRTLVEKNLVDKNSIPFSYPNGNYSSEIVKLVKESGYALAVTTEKGSNNIDALDPYLLKRIPLHEDISSSIPMFAARLTGLF